MAFFFLSPEYLADYEEQRIPSGNRLIALDDLFEINIGLMKDAYHPYIQAGEGKEQLRVLFITLGSFRKPPLQAAGSEGQPAGFFTKLEMDQLIESQKESGKESTAELRSIPSDRLLGPRDYLISLRGVPQGYSMLQWKTVQKENYLLAASNHFVQLRPRLTVNAFMPYLHLILDLIVEFHLRADFQRRVEAHAGKTYAGLNPFSVRSLRQLKIKLSDNPEIQEQEYKKFSGQYKKAIDAYQHLNKLKNKYFEKLHITAEYPTE